MTSKVLPSTNNEKTFFAPAEDMVIYRKVLLGTVKMKVTAEGKLKASLVDHGKILHHNIIGLPKEIRGRSIEVQTFVSQSYIKLAPLEGGGFALHINQGLQGGVVGEAISVALAGIEFFTGNMFQKLMNAAKENAQATVSFANEKVESSIRAARGAVDETISKALTEAKEQAIGLVDTTGEKTKHAIRELGLEARETVKITELEIEKALECGTKKADFILQKSGEEFCRIIERSGNEAKEISHVVSNEVQDCVEKMRSDASTILAQGGREIKDVITMASLDANRLLREAGDQYQIRTCNIISKALADVDRLIQVTIESAFNKSNQCLEKIAELSEGIIVAVGDQGRLLIRDTGNEIRVTADEVLTKAFRGQEMIINVAGEQARLTIQEMGYEMRSTLYEIPFIAAQTAEALGRNFAHGLLGELLGARSVNRIINNLRNSIINNNVSLYELVRFVVNQNQLSSEDKAKLYIELIEIVNKPGRNEEEIKKYFLCIGVAAFRDEKLKVSSNSLINPRRYLGGDSYLGDVLAKFPSPAREILMKEGEEAINIYLPQPVPIPQIKPPPNPLEKELKEQRLALIERDLRISELEFSQSFLDAEKEKHLQELDKKNQCLKQKEMELIQLQAQKEKELDDLRKEINQVKRQLDDAKWK